MLFSSFIEPLLVCSVLIHYDRLFCLYYAEQNFTRKGRNGTGWEKWNKTWGEVEQMRLPGLAVKTTPDSVVTGLEGSHQVQTGPDKVQFVVCLCFFSNKQA